MDVYHTICWLVMALFLLAALHSMIFGFREPPWRTASEDDTGDSILRVKSTIGNGDSGQTLLRVALPPASDGEWLLRPAVTMVCSGESLPRVPELEFGGRMPALHYPEE
jgi:hypothetical protein